MKLEDFKKDVITQKNVITQQAMVMGGNGTQTSRVDRTAIHSNAILQFFTDVFVGDNVAYKDDHRGDWNDEGTC